ncbi:MAG: Xaa-Pro dipeptidase [Acidobacteria bacterium]|nr:Xaa-Pro dipeptidase [Acidobacteriota bacterium]
MTLDALYGDHVALRAETTGRILAEAGFERLLIHSGKPYTYFADDNDAPFHATPHFTHWAPVPGPYHLLEFVPGSRPRIVRVMPRDFWYAPPAPAPDFVASRFDVVDVETEEAAWATIGNGRRTAFIGEATDKAAANGIPAESLNPQPFVSRLDWERSYKSAYEVETLREATGIAARGFRAAREVFFGGGSELDIHHAYLAATGQLEDGLPYPTIIGLDERASTLHYHGKRGREAAPGQVLLIDAGVSVRGYGCDITRTWAVTSAPAEFHALLVGMEALQQELAKLGRPGMMYPELHLLAHRKIAALLVSNGLLLCTAEEALEKGLTRPFLPHGLGHFLGVQVHDVSGRFGDRDGTPKAPPASHPFLRTTRLIEEGHLFTIEPGLYFIPMLLEPFRAGEHAALFDWALIDRLTPCGGIRIEDDVFVGKDENRNLTREELS